MTFVPNRVAIVGATGPTGIQLTHELLTRDRSVRVVSRSRTRLQQLFGPSEAEVAAADALDATALRRAVDGCELVVDCIGLPPERIGDHPVAASAIVDAARQIGARCLQVSSYWSFLPTHLECIDESSPRRGDHPWYTPRRAAEDVFLAAGAAVVHLPDFFGPHVHTSSVQLPLQEALAGSPIRCLGRAATARESGYVPDLMRTVADLLHHDEAYGTDWGAPGSGTLTPARLAELAGGHLGRTIPVRAAPPWMLRLMALFSAEVRAILPMVDHYSRPVRYDCTKLESLLGEIPRTPFEVAIPSTLEWLAATTG